MSEDSANGSEQITDAVTPVAEQQKQAQLDELFTLLKGGSGYLATVTVLSNGKLTHHMLTNNFPEIDVLKSIGAVERMAVERLKAL